MTHIKQIHKVAPKHHNQYLRHGLADEANDPTPPIQKKTFSFITFLWLPDFIFSANAAIVSFAVGKEQRPDQLTHVRAHAHDVLGSGAP